MSGELNLQRLSAPVSVIRDQNGIPHIEAKNTQDAFRALGFIMAQERLFQMEISRRVANGRLAEVFGEKALPSDKLFRNLGLRSQSEKIFNQRLLDNKIDPNMLADANAFYDGINQFVATSVLPIEFLILGIKPEPFTITDAQSFIGLMSFSFGAAIMNEPLLSKLVTRIGGDLVEDLRNEKVPANVSRVVEVDSKISDEVIKVIANLETGFGLFEGSNGWVLSGRRTASGKPIFANDPHITYSLPNIWFEAHIKTPDYETYGHFLSLLPFPVLSHNRERAWGLTMSLTDDMDIYKENIDLPNKTYLFKGEKKNLSIRREVIKVKKGQDVTLEILGSHHGPILDYAFNDESNEKSLALHWSFYHPDHDPVSSFYKMGRAKSMDEFKSAVATGKSPGLTILYADQTNIGAWLFGEIWQKRPDLKTDFILNGESGKDEIIKSLNFEEKIAEQNPSNGVIISANSRPLTYPAHMRGDWQPADRYNTIDQILRQKEKWSPEELMEVQILNVNFENKILIETLLADLHFKNDQEKRDYQKYVDMIKNWDLRSELESSAPAMYYTWTKNISVKLLKDLTVDEREIFAKLPPGWIFLKRVIADRESVWWKKFDRGELLRETFIESALELNKIFGKNLSDWQWKKIHTLEYVHPLGRVKPLDKIFNLGPYPVPGATQEVNNQKNNTFKDFQVRAGPSTRRVIDYAHPEKSWGILPIGNSGHMLSPFYNDQIERFIKGEYRPQLLDLKDSDIRFKMVMKPKI